MDRIPCIVFGVLGAVLFHVSAHAQGTARSMDIDASLRSAALGGASNALFRGGEINHWANPALLAQTQGIRYERSRTQLVPGLAANIWFTGTFTKVGAGGLGFVFGGEPDGPPGIQLDYGLSEGTDEAGNPTGTFRSFERVRSWGFGVSLLEGAENLARLGGGDPFPLSRWFDVSLGMNFKSVFLQLAPAPGGAGGTNARDVGALVRVTPIDGFGFGSPDAPPVRLDLAYGWSVLSYNDDAMITFINEDLASPVSRHRRHGGAIHLAGGALGRNLDEPFLRELARGFAPLVSLSASIERDAIGGGRAIDMRTRGHGFEVVLANVFALRRGHYEDPLGRIDGNTRGFSIGLPLGSFGGYLYEEAWIPQSRDSDLDDVHRTGYAVWIDPFAIGRALFGDDDDGGRSVSRETQPPRMTLR